MSNALHAERTRSQMTQIGRGPDSAAALFQFVEELYRASTMTDVYEAALEAITSGLGCSRASILLFGDDGVMRFVASRGLSDSYRAAVEGHSPWRVGDRDPEPICVADIAASTESEALKATIQRENICGLCFIPITAGNAVIGKFMAYHERPHTFTDGELELALAIARQLGFNIERARAEEQLRLSEERLRYANARLAERVELESGARQRVQSYARAQSEQFRILVEGVIDYAIYMLDPDGRVSTWNAGARRAKGYLEHEIVGQHFSIFYTPEARAAGEPERALAAARDTGRIEMQGWRVRKDGTQFWAHVVIDGIRDEQGNLLGFAKITRDATEQRDNAEKLQQAREALFQAQKMEAVGQLTGGIAHDFNNMLAGIMGGLQLLQRRLKAGRYDETEKYITLAFESANRAAGLTSRLLAFGRRQTLDIKSVDVNDTIRSMSVLLRRTVSENIAIDLQVDDDPLWASTDAHQLESAILNLALNARDAMPHGGKLTIATRRERVTDVGQPARDVSVIDIIDTGVGMPPDVAARAFEPFFTTKPMGAGTGLGLSMVYGFLNQSGGRIDLASVEGEGTRVRLLLPAAEMEKDEAPAFAGDLAAEGRGEVVLVVEDEAPVRMLIVDVLRDLGYAAHEAGSADEALPILETGARIDLLVTDVGLPGLNGRQLSEIARKLRPELKVLFLTGYAEHAALRSDFVQSGMDLMQKPFRVEDLAARIEEMTRATASV